MQQTELHGDHCARKKFKTLKPEEFSPYRRSAAVESLETLQLMNSDATYVVVTASPELVYTRIDDDILEPEIRRVDGSQSYPINQYTVRQQNGTMTARQQGLYNSHCPYGMSPSHRVSQRLAASLFFFKIFACYLSDKNMRSSSSPEIKLSRQPRRWFSCLK